MGRIKRTGENNRGRKYELNERIFGVELKYKCTDKRLSFTKCVKLLSEQAKHART